MWAAPWDFNAVVAELYRQTGPCAHGSPNKKGEEVKLTGSALPSDVVRTSSACGGSLYCRGNLTCYTPGGNAFTRTLRSTSSCALQLLRDFLPVFEKWLCDGSIDRSAKFSLSCVGHSFGGIILRELLYLLLISEEASDYNGDLFESVKRMRQKLAELAVVMEHFVTIATPHCGAAECLPTPMYHAALGIAMTCAPSVREILLKDDDALLSERLIDEGHIEALRVFRRRTVFANTRKDMLVGFATSSLVYNEGSDDKVRLMGDPSIAFPCDCAFENDVIPYSKVMRLDKVRTNETADSSGNAQVITDKGDRSAEESQDHKAQGNEHSGMTKAHRAPREIAAALRRDLDWELVAMRYTNPLPVAHIACIGWCQQLNPTPELVRRVAAGILDEGSVSGLP
uniref:DUF676 domain-containing protein n=1 Tax=Trypanosoma congolense (strain IL3000) TaxID=1068625 RepID=G0URM7_TRYCI|nr:conserved hypothetical protein [Trypanosoma congolense IL3000]